MRNPIISALLASAIALLASCAFITVNVYFPEKEVKKAFKTLDEQLLRQDGEAAPGNTPGQPAGTAAPAAGAGDGQPPAKENP